MPQKQPIAEVPQIVISAQAVIPLKVATGMAKQIVIRWVTLVNPNPVKFPPGQINKWYIKWVGNSEQRDCVAFPLCRGIASGHKIGPTTCGACDFASEDMDTMWLGVLNDVVRSSKRPREQMLMAKEGLVTFMLYAPGDRQVVARAMAKTFESSPAPPPPPRQSTPSPKRPAPVAGGKPHSEFEETRIEVSSARPEVSASHPVRNYTKTFAVRFKLIDGIEQPRYFDHADHEKAVDEYFRLEMSGRLPKLMRCGQREDKAIDRPTLLRRFIVMERARSTQEHNRLHWFDTLITVTSGSRRRLIGKVSTKDARQRADDLGKELRARVELFEIKSSSLRDKPKGVYDHLRPAAPAAVPPAPETGVLSGSDPAESPARSDLAIKAEAPHPAREVEPIDPGNVSVLEGRANLTISNDGPNSATAYRNVPVEFVLELLLAHRKHNVPIKFQGEFSHQEV